MSVALLRKTPDAMRLCAAAAHGCYSEYPSLGLDSGMISDSDLEKTLRRVIRSGHISVLEHASYTWSVWNVSRALTHQLVRHRVASYSQQSQRYVAFAARPVLTDMFVVPPAIEEAGLKDKYLSILINAIDGYTSLWGDLVDWGRTKEQAQEDARFVLPNAAKTQITVTMNARELYHFFELRCCKRAQWEIRELALDMFEICKDTDPVIFAYAGVPCMFHPASQVYMAGQCKEGGHGCGDPYQWRLEP